MTVAVLLVSLTSCLNDQYSIDQVVRGAKVVYDFNYEDSPDAKIQFLSLFEYENPVLDKINLARTGYTFLGWAESSDSQDVKYEDGAGVYFGNDKKLYAVWKEHQYTIKYELNEGNIDTEDEIEVLYSREVQLPQAQKEGNLFAGWYKDSNYEPNSKITGKKASKLSSEDGALVTLNARWISKDNITDGLEKLSIAVPFTKYNYVYGEEIDFSPVEILFDYEEDNLYVSIPYSIADFHYTLFYDNGQTEEEGSNGRDVPGENIVMTIYYNDWDGPGANAIFNIRKATVDITEPLSLSNTYNGESQALANEGVILHSFTGQEVTDMHFEYSIDGGETYTAQIPAATDTGVYTIDWKIVVDDDKSAFYDLSTETLSGSFETTIELAPVTLEWNVGEYVYDGSLKGPTAVIESGIFNEDNVDVQVSGQQVNAGEDILASATLTNGSNYFIINPQVTYSIAPAPVTVTVAPTSTAVASYTGDSITLANAGTVSDTSLAKIQYSLENKDESFSDVLPTGLYASHYSVFWKTVLTDTSGNYGLSGTTSGSFVSQITNGLMPGEFTINSNGDAVRFTSGLLYWDGEEFKIEDNQYDFRTWEAKSSVIDGVSSATGTPTGHVGLFFWSNNITLTYTGSFGDQHVTAQDTFALANGGAIQGYDVLTASEMNYLLNSRTGAGSKKGHTTITMDNGTAITGVVFLPDSWTLPAGCTFSSGTGYGRNNYNEIQWASMESAGAVFYPAVGLRKWGGTTVEGSGYAGYFHSSTPAVGSTRNFVWNLSVEPNKVVMGDLGRNYDGCGVRLVQREN